VLLLVPPCSATPEYHVLPDVQSKTEFPGHAGSDQVMVHAAGSGSPLAHTFAEKSQVVGPTSIFTWYHLFPDIGMVLTDFGHVQVPPLMHF
jgi:hypothetical protein